MNGKPSQDLAKLISSQHGVITSAQAVAAGLSYDTIARRSTGEKRRWQRLLPGVYLTVTGTPTRDQMDTAALLYAGTASALTGRAALLRYHLRAPRGDRVDVVVPAACHTQSRGFVTIHRTTRMPEFVCYRGPISYVPVARAVADAVRQLSDQPEARAVVAAAIQSRQCTIEQLVTEIQDGPVRDSALLRVVVGEALDGVRSAAEGDLRSLIKRGKLPEPIYNARLFLDGELIAIADAWWPEAAVAVEVDSKRWHLSPADWERTMRRHARMTALGILVLHFSPNQIRDEPGVVLAQIRMALRSRRGQSVPPIETRPMSDEVITQRR